MVKFDASALRYLSRNDFRVLTALEMGMKNHDLVPTVLIVSISGLKKGLCMRAIKVLHKNKLVYHESVPYDGYRLTYHGYDFLALKAFVARGTICAVGQKLGVGKEADIFTVCNDDGEEFILKLHRLGRTSFRSIKNNRDYLKHRKSASWFYMSRLAALKEFAFMKVLHKYDFPVPQPIDQNRHAIIMTRIKGYQLNQVTNIRHPHDVYGQLMELIIRMARHGLIHCDFNEFNLIIDNEEHVTLIDFPQMVSVDHENAEKYFDRDVQCIRSFFERRMGFVAENFPSLRMVKEMSIQQTLDCEVQASGFTPSHNRAFEKMVRAEVDAAGKKEKGEIDDEAVGDNGDNDDNEWKGESEGEDELEDELIEEEGSGESQEEMEEIDPQEMARRLLERNRLENLPSQVNDGGTAANDNDIMGRKGREETKGHEEEYLVDRSDDNDDDGVEEEEWEDAEATAKAHQTKDREITKEKIQRDVKRKIARKQSLQRKKATTRKKKRDKNVKY